MEMPHQQSGHKRNNDREDHHADHSPDFPRTLFLLELLVIRCWQELDGRVPVFVLEDKQTDRQRLMNDQYIKLKRLYQAKNNL